MSWSANVKASREDIRTAVQNLDSIPAELSEGPAAQFELAKAVADDILDELGGEAPMVSVAMSGHSPEEGTTPYASLSVSVNEAPAEQPAQEG